MATNETISIVVAQRGAAQVRRELAGIGDASDKSARSLSLLARALWSVGLGLSLVQLKETVDTYTNLSNRLRLVATDTQNLARLQDAVFRSAQRTRTSYESLAVLYSRTALNASELGLSQQEILDLSESVAQAFRISGATAAESRGAIIQFTQGLAQGTLRGQELLSVMEQAPRLAQAIASGMGVSVAELKRLGEQGLITSEQISDAMKKAAPQLREEFAKLRPTLDDAFTVLNNGFMRTLGQLDQATGASQLLAQAIMALGSNTKLFGAVLVAVGGLLVIAFLPALASAAVAAAALMAALAVNPLTWIVAAVAGLMLFGDQIAVSSDGLVTLIDWVKAAAQVIMEWLAPLGKVIMDMFGLAWNFLLDTWGQVSGFFARNFDNLVGLAGVLYRAYVGIFSGLVQAIVAAFQNLPAAIEGIFKTMMNGAITIVEVALKGISAPINDLLRLVKLPEIPPVDLSGFKQELSKDAQDVAGIIGDAFGRGFTEGDLAAQRTLGTLDKLLGEINDRARVVAEQRRAMEAAATDGTLPTDPGPNGLPKPKMDSETANRLKRLLEEIGGAQLKLEQGQRDLNLLLESGAITLEQYNTKLRELRLAALDASLELGDGLATGLLKVQDRLADVADAAERIVVNAFQNAEDALVEFVTTGKLDFKGFVDSLLADIARLAIRQAILGPLAGLMGGMFGFAGGGPVGFAGGGYVSGPGSGTSDSILAALSNGEFVVNAKATQDFLPLLEAMNSGRPVPRFAGGGVAASPSSLYRAPVPMSGASVQIIDQRSGGAPIEVSRSRGPSGEEQVRFIVRDEVNRIHESTKEARRRETRAFVLSDRAVGNI